MRQHYFVLHHGGSWILTFHAPWCRCDVRHSGWRFEFSPGYLSGLGFELSWTTAADRAVG